LLLLFSNQNHISPVQEWINTHHQLNHFHTVSIGEWTAFYCDTVNIILREELTGWRKELRTFSADILQSESLLQPDQQTLFAFDMDSTVIQQEVIDELARAHGVYDEIASVTKEAMEGNLDFAQALRKRCSLLKGLPVSALDQVYSSLTFNDGMKELLEELKKRNVITCIFSGGFTHILERFQQEHGITEVRANVLEIENGVLTGNVLGDIVGKEQKRDHLLSIRNQHGIKPTQTVALGDGANDLLMLNEAGCGIGVHAKDGLKQQIKNWIDFAPMYVLSAFFAPV
jgi:phosphoserine phosphatase